MGRSGGSTWSFRHNTTGRAGRRLWRPVVVIAVMAVGLGLFAHAADAEVVRVQDCAAVAPTDPAPDSMKPLPDGEAVEVALGASVDPAVRSSTDYLRGRGFHDSGERVALRGADGSTIVHILYASSADPHGSAAAISHRIGTTGERATELTTIGADGDMLVPQASTAVHAGRIPDLTQGVGARTYTSCMVFCLSAQCGSNASKCNHIPNLAAKLACMVAVCATSVPGCDRMCRALR
jgi:hypothetical protein